MYQLIIVVHVLLGIGIVGLILMQQGKGADAGAAFGSGGSGSVFGAQGSASFLSRTTAIFATLFFSTSLALAGLSGKQSKNVDIMDSPEAAQVKKITADVPPAAKTAVPSVLPVNDKTAVVPAADIPVIGEEKPVTPAAVENKTESDANAKTTSDERETEESSSAKETEKSEKPADKAEKSVAEDKKATEKSEKKSEDKEGKSDKKAKSSEKAKTDKKTEKSEKSDKKHTSEKTHKSSDEE